MSAEKKSKPLLTEILDIREDWRRIWYAMAKGDPIRMSEITKMEVADFYSYYDKWIAEVKTENKKT